MTDEQEPWDDVWSEGDTTPAKIEAALRDMLATRHHADARVRARAGAQPRRDRRQRVPRRDREPPPARRALPPVAARAVLGRATGRDDDRRAGGRSAPTHVRRPGPHRGRRASASSSTSGRAPPRPSSTRSSTRCSSPTSRRWCGRRTATPKALDALRRLAQIVLLDSQDEPTSTPALDRAAELSEQRLRRRPRVAALDAVARADGRRVRPAGRALARSARSPR